MQVPLALLAFTGLAAFTVAQNSTDDFDSLPDSMKCLTNDDCPSGDGEKCVEDCLGIPYPTFENCNNDCYLANGGEDLNRAAGFKCFVDCVVEAQQKSSTPTTSSASVRNPTTSATTSTTSVKMSQATSSATESDDSSSTPDDFSAASAQRSSVLASVACGFAFTAWSFAGRL
ncbi:hypothetical protein IWQ60_008031 [Tieghemiomyces parasiticus]|uniref:Uncharacterized protein n=1 Tax=Tieghemiomyces parasiticus TaxID=78921 RepID=A0A9W7ZY97_9FUNG|nr:hypothetical protein IWQ60_008031 [Tieghemiomyces parasiticus]